MPETSTPIIPQHIIQAIQQGNLLPIVGAGVSRSVKNKAGEFAFPTWKELLELAAGELKKQAESNKATIVSALVKDNNYQLAADQANEGLKGTLWRDFLINQFDLQKSDIDENSLDLPRAIWQLSKQIITLNYDNVLKWACDNSDIDLIDNSNNAELKVFANAKTNKPTIWHLHGRIGNTGSIVLKSPDYKKLYEANAAYEAALKTLQNIGQQRTLLFIGCGMDDKELLAVIEYQYHLFGKNTGPHYVIVHKDNLDVIKAKIDDENLIFISFEDYGKPLVDLVNHIAQSAKAGECDDQEVEESDEEDESNKPAKTKIAVLTANPINDEQDYSDCLKEFKKLDADIEHFALTINNLNSLDDHEYVFIASKVIQGRLLAEDDYLASHKLPFDEIEDAIGADNVKGVFYLVDKLPDFLPEQEQPELEFPSLIISVDELKQRERLLFELFRKNRFNKLRDCLAFNEQALDLNACKYEKDSQGVCFNATQLPLAVDPNNLKGLVGRKNDIEAICRKLIKLSDDVGVLTIKGSGGIGKTTSVKKVAYELAQRRFFSSKIAFIDCEAISDFDGFNYHIAKVFDLQQQAGFGLDKIRDCNKADRLVILDNLETLLHIEDKAKCLALIQSLSNYATVVITSRELSEIEGEEAYELRPLTVDEATEFFIQRAKLSNLSQSDTKLLREDIVEKLLNNNPLAIKLVIANMPEGKNLSVLKGELEDDIFKKTTEDDLLAFDSQADTNIDRKRSIYGSIAYSYRSLQEDEKRALLLLSTFPDGIAIEMLTRLETWVKEEDEDVSNIVTDRTVRALQNKSMVDTHGGGVKLQSIVANFAEKKLETHDNRRELMAQAFAFQHIMVMAIKALQEVNTDFCFSVAEFNLATLVKSIELYIKLIKQVDNESEVLSSQIVTHIGALAQLLYGLGEWQILVMQLNKFIGEFADNLSHSKAIELTQLILQFVEANGNSNLNFETGFKINFPLLSTYLVANGAHFGITEYGKDLSSTFELKELYSLIEKNEGASILLYYALGEVSDASAKFLSSRSSVIYEIKSHFGLIKVNELDKTISSLHDKSIFKLELSYTRAKRKLLSKAKQEQLVQIMPDSCYAAGLRAMVAALSTADSKISIKENHFKTAFNNLKQSPYYLAEAYYYYAKFLLHHNRPEFADSVAKGMELVKKYHFRYIHYQFDVLRGKTANQEYDPKDYPLPNGMDLTPYLQKYLDTYGVNAKKRSKKRK